MAGGARQPVRDVRPASHRPPVWSDQAAAGLRPAQGEGLGRSRFRGLSQPDRGGRGDARRGISPPARGLRARVLHAEPAGTLAGTLTPGPQQPGGEHAHPANGHLGAAAGATAPARPEHPRAGRAVAQHLGFREHPVVRHEQLDQPEARSGRAAPEPVPFPRHAAGPRHPARGPTLRPHQGQLAAELGEPGSAREPHRHQLPRRRGRFHPGARPRQYQSGAARHAVRVVQRQERRVVRDQAGRANRGAGLHCAGLQAGGPQRARRVFRRCVARAEQVHRPRLGEGPVLPAL